MKADSRLDKTRPLMADLEPVPVHLQPAVKMYRKGRGSRLESEPPADEFLSLPKFPDLAIEPVGEAAVEVTRI